MKVDYLAFKAFVNIVACNMLLLLLIFFLQFQFVFLNRLSKMFHMPSHQFRQFFHDLLILLRPSGILELRLRVFADLSQQTKEHAVVRLLQLRWVIAWGTVGRWFRGQLLNQRGKICGRGWRCGWIFKSCSDFLYPG